MKLGSGCSGGWEGPRVYLRLFCQEYLLISPASGAELPGGLVREESSLLQPPENRHCAGGREASHLMMLISTPHRLYEADWTGAAGKSADSQVPFPSLHFISMTTLVLFNRLPVRLPFS